MKRLALFGLLVLAVPLAQAEIFGFGCITNNLAADCDTGEAQLTVEVTAVGANQVLFTFRNEGPLASSITDVYFDDGTLLGIASINNTDGSVEFSQFASPGNLSGANNISPAFQTTAGFSADSDQPVQPMGVNPGETLGILFNLINGQNFQDTLDAIALAGADGGLRIGIHVQGFAGGGSEGLVNNDTPLPPTEIPEPTSVLLFGTLAAVAVQTMKRKLEV